MLKQKWRKLHEKPTQPVIVHSDQGSQLAEFVAYHEHLLFADVDLFNDRMLDYLVWFNTERPHYGLGLISPYEHLKLNHQCHMYWQKTNNVNAK